MVSVRYTKTVFTDRLVYHRSDNFRRLPKVNQNSSFLSRSYAFASIIRKVKIRKQGREFSYRWDLSRIPSKLKSRRLSSTPTVTNIANRETRQSFVIE